MTSYNDENVAGRIRNKNALAVIYSFKGNASLNHEMHLSMKDVLEKNKIKLLINSTESKDYLETKKEYKEATTEGKVLLELVFVQGDLLINEMLNLSYEINKNSNTLKLTEPRNGTKDRYISLAMGNYIIKELEKELQKPSVSNNILDYCYF